VNKLYFGDCLDVLRNEIADDSVDLVYLDPPFNSSRNYNLLFQAPTGHNSEAQIGAFKDTWHWGEQAEREFRELLHQPRAKTSDLISALRSFLGENDMMAYLVMITSRLLELRRVIRSTGSIYLHCDPTSSHYLKLLMDASFDPENFRNEIIWKRTSTKGDYKQGATNWPRIHDVVLYYCRDESKHALFNQPFSGYEERYKQSKYSHVDESGRRYGLWDMTAPGSGSRGHPQYEFMGVMRFWRYSREKMEQLAAEGRVIQPSPKAIPRYKRYLDEMPGVALGDIWSDIPPINSQAAERLGYPTQKPQELLERIISASSNPDDVVLDPFCGCGTTVHAAQKLGRQWIGVDITHLAVSLIEKRLRDAFPGIEFEVFGTPKDLEGARDLAIRDKYQFQWWACSLVGAQPWQDKKKGADRGIDGIIYFQDEKGNPKKIIVSVKGGETVGRAMIADLKNSVEREKAQIGLFVTLTSPTKEMVKEALTAGFYESPNFKSGEYPKIQVLTIEGLLKGTQRPRYPDLSQGAYTFKRATQELEAAEDKADLFTGGV
jgi:DNA modification methylase